MMKNKAINALIEIGMPTGIKGFDYIVDAMCMFDKDISWKNKITALYWKLGEIHSTSATSVERSIRHAFGVAFKKGKREAVEKYFCNQIPTNSNLLSILYIKLSQEV